MRLVFSTRNLLSGSAVHARYRSSASAPARFFAQLRDARAQFFEELLLIVGHQGLKPFLRLQGRWLGRAGFAVGADVRVQAKTDG